MKLNYQASSLLAVEQIQTAVDSQKSYTEHLQSVVSKANYEDAESSINLSSDTELLENVQAMVSKKVTPALKYIIDIGIGGSNLGTKAVYDALHGYFDVLEDDRFPKMIFADTNDPEFLAKLVVFIESKIASPAEILVNAISKSGGTTETIANLEIILAALEKKFPDGKSRLVITTDEGSKLETEAQKHGVDYLSMPKSVGGRYSVLSAVGLFPLASAGFDIKALREGAESMRTLCLTGYENPALISSAVLFLQHKNGHTINDNFVFHPELESLGKWYRQLMGESIGKEHDLDGKIVYAGITPTVSVGSTDLHSVGQLYFGGPRDKTATIIASEKIKQDVTLPATLQFPLVQHIEGKKASDLMYAIREGVKAAYTGQKIPYMEVLLDDISARSIGEFMQFKMIEMMYLGKLFNVNTFDQPHVELYKVETKRILSE